MYCADCDFSMTTSMTGAYKKHRTFTPNCPITNSKNNSGAHN
ncbi:hypothetical protein JCM19240_6798 [Vibrio maritimus]|uniref:Uncharacterized protein n=1 Tax=Vibrio maritimus TaxID=990268 RepID=A0A090TCF8_9VIBR|nr:hypothetical protein JCM19240_6798 [Vibrio maritimus]